MARVAKKKEEKQLDSAVEVKVEKSLTRAEKKTAAQQLIKDVLQKNPHKHNDLIDEVAKAYASKFGGEDTENINDVKGRVGSVLDIMKKDGDVLYEGGVYALKTQTVPMKTENSEVKTEEEKTEKPVKKATRAKAKKTEATTTKKAEAPTGTPMETLAEKNVEKVEETSQKEETKRAKKTLKTTKEAKTTKATKKELKAKEKEPAPQTEQEEILPLPPAPLQPIAPVAPTTPEVAPEPTPATPMPAKEAPTKQEPVKKAARSKAKKATEMIVEKETPSHGLKTENEPPMVALKEEKREEKAQEGAAETPVEIKNPPIVKEKGEIAPKDVVDMSFLFGNVKPKIEKIEKTGITEEKIPKEEKFEVKEQKTEIKTPAMEKSAVETNGDAKQEKADKTEKVERKAPVKQETKQETKQEVKEVTHPMRRASTRGNVKEMRKVERPQTADERLRDAYLKRMRALGGDYFEYYSIYLLERYSMKNGRRLEGMRISGGDHDGGIDGEIELTDKFGFKETIYIQSKNWDPEKGKEEYWVVGETLLQQFIGACACRQAKERKQHCRGIFITTSRFTPEAKRILEDMSDKIVGYDGADLYEAAKECQFGVIYENGNWKLDEKLLSGAKAFFNML